MDATTRLVAIIILTSFATERIVAAADYLLGLLGPEGAQRRREAPRKLLLIALGGFITAAVVVFANIRILPLVTANPPAGLDLVLTWLVVFAGADLVRTLLQGGGGSEASAKPEPSKAPAVRIQIDRDGTVRELSGAS